MRDDQRWLCGWGNALCVVTNIFLCALAFTETYGALRWKEPEPGLYYKL